MFRYYKILLILSLALITSCDSMKSISSKYNILYNGDLFLNEGLDQLRNSYKDNFWDIIPVIVDNNIVIILVLLLSLGITRFFRLCEFSSGGLQSPVSISFLILIWNSLTHSLTTSPRLRTGSDKFAIYDQ